MANKKTAGQSDVVSTIGWLGTILVLIIPIVGLVVYLIWAFSGGNLNRRNYCRATLILMAISLLFGIVLSAAIGSLIAMVTQNLGAFW